MYLSSIISKYIKYSINWLIKIKEENQYLPNSPITFGAYKKFNFNLETIKGINLDHKNDYNLDISKIKAENMHTI